MALARVRPGSDPSLTTRVGPIWVTLDAFRLNLEHDSPHSGDMDMLELGEPIDVMK